MTACRCTERGKGVAYIREGSSVLDRTDRCQCPHQRRLVQLVRGLLNSADPCVVAVGQNPHNPPYYGEFTETCGPFQRQLAPRRRTDSSGGVVWTALTARVACTTSNRRCANTYHHAGSTIFAWQQ